MKSPSSTYYYHYDVHGNTLKVTDTNQDTRITYTYDTLGNITSQTNPDSIPNPFTFMGASQTILDTETNLYFSSGYYNPQTGTLLQGTGSPAMPNPTSISTINSMSTSSLPEAQLLSHSITSATTAGSSSGGEPGSFAPPSGPEDGISHSGKQSGPPSLDSMSIGGISISYSGGGNSWVNRSVLTEGSGLGNNYMPPDPPKPKKDADKKNPDDSDLNKWYDRRSCVVGGEGGGTADPTPPPSMPKMAEDSIPQISWGWAASSDGKKYTGYDSSDSADPVNDTDPSDDNKEYIWVIRDKNGNITACCTRAENVYIFDTNPDGTRKSTKNLCNIVSYSPKDDGSKMVSSWVNICTSVSSKDSKIVFYNEANYKTSGSIGMCINSKGLWLGIFVDKSGVKVKEGRYSDFSATKTPKCGSNSNADNCAETIKDFYIGSFAYTYLSDGVFLGETFSYRLAKGKNGPYYDLSHNIIKVALWSKKSQRWTVDHLANW